MVKFTSKSSKKIVQPKIPLFSSNSYLKPQNFISHFTDNNNINMYLLKRKNLLNNYIIKNTYTKNPVKYFFDLTLSYRLEKLQLLSKKTKISKSLVYLNQLETPNITKSFNLWSFPRFNSKKFTRYSFLILKKLLKEKKVSKKKWKFIKRFKSVKKRIIRFAQFKRNILKRRRGKRIWSFRKRKLFFFNKPYKKFFKGYRKKKFHYNLKLYCYLNYITDRSKTLKPQTKTFIKNLSVSKKLTPLPFKKRRFNKNFFKKKLKFKFAYNPWRYTSFFNAGKRFSIRRIGLQLFSSLKPKTEKFFSSNFNKLNNDLNLKKFKSKYSYYSTGKRTPYLYLSRFVRFKQLQTFWNQSINSYVKFLNPKYKIKISSTNNIILTTPLTNNNIINSFMLSYFFKTFNTDPVNPITRLLSINKVMVQLFSKPLNLRQIKPFSKTSNIKKNHVLNSQPLKKYYLIKPLVTRTFKTVKSKKWSINKFNLELNNFVFFSKSTKLKFSIKKTHLNLSSFKFKNFKMFSLSLRKFSANDPFSSTYNLVSDMGFMPALPLIYYEDAPGFLLNYDTETLYKAMPCPSKKINTFDTTNFLVSLPKSYKLYKFHLQKGGSYFELNNVLNPSLGHSSINQKKISKKNLDYSASLVVSNFGLYASLKHVNSLDDHNSFPFRKYSDVKIRARVFKRTRHSISKPYKPKRLFYKIRKIKGWTKSKFKKFLDKYGLTEGTPLLNNSLFLNKKSLFKKKISIQQFSKSHPKRFNKFSKSNFRYFCKSVTLSSNIPAQTFDYPHKSSLLTLSDTFLKSQNKNKYKPFFDILFENFSNINKFIYSNDILLRLLTNRFFFKNFIYKFNSFTSTKSIITSIIYALARNSRNYFFNDRVKKYRKSNLIPLTCFNFEIQRFVVQHVRGGLWLMVSTQTITTLLIRFVENVSGRKALLRFAPNAFKFLDIKDHARAIAWEPRIKSWQLMLGPKFFAAESLKLIGVMLRSRDPYFFTKWVVLVSSRLDFFNHRRFFRLIRLLLKWYYSLFFDEFGLTGIKLKFKGKISVAGNSRKRSQFARAGITSNSKVSNRVTSDINYIYTFTGAVAFQIWLYF